MIRTGFMSVGVCHGGRYSASKGSKPTTEYVVWSGMLKRCYGAKYQAKHPTYIGCTVSDTFKDFQYFAEWCNNQIGFGNEGWELDKDILYKGNKYYSEDTCVFVPRKVNTLLVQRKSKRGDFPVGVHFDKQTKRYYAQCIVRGVRRNLGRYDTPEEAFSVYKKAKEKAVAEVAEHFKDVIDLRVYLKLTGWVVDIDD